MAQNAQEIEKLKLNGDASGSKFCHGKNTQCLTELVQEALSYQYEETPKYGKLRFLMEKMMIKDYKKK